MKLEKIQFKNDEISLAGKLAMPINEKRNPLIIVAHTSGSATKDSEVYQHLIDILPKNGFAVFIFDRRGSGESTGNFENATFLDLASDIIASIDLLKRRNNIDSNKIGIWGLSQGGWIAPLVASESEDVSFIIPISSSGVSPAEQMDYSAEFELRDHGFSEKKVKLMLNIRKFVNQYFRGEKDNFEVLNEVELVRNEDWFKFAYLDGELPKNPSETKWFQELDFTPIPVIKKICIPVLLLYGEKDPWVPIQKSIEIWKNYGPKDLNIQQIKGANHFMRSITKSGLRNDTGIISKEYIDVLLHWLNNLYSKESINHL
ncbi:hypothetical protein NEF87_001608 [Candidatus Lokiarchaeum ossiferum]|uniref:BD-FAE-like domain-containing protein n=1 Tax=Candidatus Lokiarchaeum ossiferum TaxID=2951803 RepID=A0ABY6HP79_9ARCH|nr:hypothetical protein NEF87_001608 [Candidatus Lokiarchaeum sp. B-35]